MCENGPCLLVDVELRSGDPSEHGVIFPFHIRKFIAEHDRNNVTATGGEDLHFPGDRLGFRNGLTRGNKDKPLRVPKGAFAFLFPVVPHRVLCSVQEAIYVATFDQPLRQRHGVLTAAGPVVGDEVIVAPTGDSRKCSYQRTGRARGSGRRKGIPLGRGETGRVGLFVHKYTHANQS